MTQTLTPAAVLEAFNDGFDTEEIAAQLTQTIGSEVTEAVVYNLLGKAREPKTPSREIILQVAKEFGLTSRDILGRNREYAVVAARTEAIKRVMAEWPHLSMPVIGRLFNRDHTTILHLLGRTSRSRARLNQQALGAAAE